MRKLGLILLFVAATAVAQQQRPYSEVFPSDYKPRPCTESIGCTTFVDVDFPSAAFQFLLRNLEPEWVAANDAAMRKMVEPYCAKRATCMTVPANEWWFCNDVFATELRNACDSKYTPKSHDNVQCHTWMDTYSAGVDQRGSADWRAAQACAKNLPPATTAGRLEWWSVPSSIPFDYTGNIRIYTIDADSHIPIMSTIKIGDQIIYATDPPTGRPTSYYVFKWPRKLVRVPNAQGHEDVIAPIMTITAGAHEPISVPVPTSIQKVTASIKPEKLHAGPNHVTVTVVDAATGKPVDAQVYIGEQTVGFANQPFELTLPKRKHPDVWVKSPYDSFSDVVLVPSK